MIRSLRRPRPLNRIRSIKAKWSIVIVAAVAVTAAMSQTGYYLGWPVWIRPIISAGLALIAVQFLAHGMTGPLREMASATGQMAKGDYRRVDVRANDEVGQLAASFNVMVDELAQVDRARKEFVANASHELRTPVAALRSQLENLADGVSEPSPEAFALMLAQGEHLSKLVSQLLDLSRLESAGVAMARDQVGLAVVLKEVVREAELLHPSATIAIETPDPLQVVADEARLHQLFTNLLANSIRFSPPDRPITLRADRSPDGVRVRVCDLGPGIEPNDRARVFEPFWQADGSAPTGGGGAGLGLAICKRIVDGHGGEIAITANRPRGTCVTVFLPRHGVAAVTRP